MIEILLDGPEGTKIGQMVVGSTGDWNKWQTLNAVLESGTSTMDVWLKFKGGEGALFNLDWIDFN